MASLKDHTRSQVGLGMAYRTRGVKKNLIYAYAWFNCFIKSMMMVQNIERPMKTSKKILIVISHNVNMSWKVKHLEIFLV